MVILNAKIKNPQTILVKCLKDVNMIILAWNMPSMQKEIELIP